MFMAKIPGIVYLIIGGGVAYVARYLSNEDLNLDFFFWIGIVFMAIGVFKIVLSFITRMPKSGKENQTANDKPQLVSSRKN